MADTSTSTPQSESLSPQENGVPLEPKEDIPDVDGMFFYFADF